jgi:peptidyl-prolyl cis-trans isomerase D
MAAAVRQSDRQSLDDLAKKFNLEVGVTSLAGVTDPVLPLGDSPELHEALFALRTGELSRPIEIDSGYVILTVKDIKSAHQATLAEVHDRALQDYQNEKSGDLARARAEELSKRAQAGEDFDKTAKSLGLATRTSDSVARSGSVPDIGSAKQIAAAFNMTVGQVSAPAQSGSNWFVFRAISREPFNPADLAAQQNDIFQQLLQTKQSAAFEAFRTDLIARLKKDGKLTINSEAFDRITKSS